MRVGPDERVRIGLAERVIVDEHHAREVLEVDLVNDPGVRRDHLEVLERSLSPAQERVALAVALELELRIARERAARPEHVDLDRMVDHELGGSERVDLRGVAAHRAHRVAHRGQVDHGRHPGEVLHEHARRRERDLGARLGAGVPSRQRLDVLRANRFPVLVAQQVLEQDLQRERQPRDVVRRLERVEPEDLIRALPDGERRLGVEGIGHHGSFLLV